MFSIMAQFPRPVSYTHLGQRFTAIKAYDLLKLCQKEIPITEQEKITDIFRSKKLVEINDFVNINIH